MAVYTTENDGIVYIVDSATGTRRRLDTGGEDIENWSDFHITDDEVVQENEQDVAPPGDHIASGEELEVEKLFSFLPPDEILQGIFDWMGGKDEEPAAPEEGLPCSEGCGLLEHYKGSHNITGQRHAPLPKLGSENASRLDTGIPKLSNWELHGVNYADIPQLRR